MAGRKRHSAEDIVRKLRRADELAAGVSPGEWWESAEASGRVRSVSFPFCGWAIA